MRRSHAGHGFHPPSSSGDYVEEENDRMTDELKDKIGVLKSLSIDIGAEVKYQDKLIKGLDDDFDKGQGVLGKTMSHVLKLSRGSHNYYLLYLILFSFLVFIILWIGIKYK
ncbi:BET1 homolog [Ischnura elegans]|uniref:BET1 homolog n=1 Tax=Ischnura elegans TaxID=197161 RepID=UPI001ED8BA02|nr:BET1 homolog [Ischnura elegans]XP_046384443.1 BET1 homolog [Ischnura elegans]XP_046384445.1 BET1 homolog [Ischnura elegans]